MVAGPLAGSALTRVAGWLVTVLLATLAVAIIQAPGWGWRAPRTAAMGVLVLVVLVVLVRAETRRPEPLIQFGLFRRASFTGACLMGTCGIAELAGAWFLSSLYLQDARSMSAAMAACAPLAGLASAN